MLNQETFLKAVGSTIQEKRVAQKMKAGDLAKSVGLSRASISNLENGRQNISAYQLYKIATALDCVRIDDLMPKTKNQVPAAVKAWLKN